MLSSCVCLSVCLSFTRRSSIKRLNKISSHKRPRIAYDSRETLTTVADGWTQSATVTLGHYRSPVTVPFDKPCTISYQSSVASLSCTISKLSPLISQNLQRSCDPEHIPFGGNLSCMHQYSSVSISTQNLKYLA